MNKTGTTGTYGTLAENQAKMDAWLEKFRNCGNVRLSCEAVGVGRTTVYRWRRQWATFAAKWEEAQEDATDILEATAWKRAVEDASDRLLMFLLKAHRRQVYGDKIDHSVMLKNLDLTALTTEQLERIASGEDVLHVLATPGKG